MTFHDGILCVDSVCLQRGAALLLDSVSLRVQPGEILGIFGPSGAGKSTLFRVIAGELAPTRGSVRLGDRTFAREPLWQRARFGLGYLPQTPSVLLDLSLRDNLTVFEATARERIGPSILSLEELLDDLGLAPRLGVRASSLSGGERRRLELIRALLGRPSILLCDEPFSGMDPLGAEKVGRWLQRFTESGGAVLLADHHVTRALRLCTRATLLVDGQVLHTDSSEPFSRHKTVKALYIGQ